MTLPKNIISYPHSNKVAINSVPGFTRVLQEVSICLGAEWSFLEKHPVGPLKHSPLRNARDNKSQIALNYIH